MKYTIDFVTHPASLPPLGSPFEFIPTSLHVIIGLASPVGFLTLLLALLAFVWTATSPLLCCVPKLVFAQVGLVHWDC